MKKTRQYQMPVTTVQDMAGYDVMISNSVTTPKVIVEENDDTDNDPNGSRSIWDEWDDWN